MQAPLLNPEVSAPLLKYEDSALFILPKDKELQFPAIATVQAYVNGYGDKISEASTFFNLSRDYAYGLEYAIEGDLEIWDILLRCGLELQFGPVAQLSQAPTIVGAMSDDLIYARRATGRHAQQVCESLIGAASMVLPAVPKRLPRGCVWAIFQEDIDLLEFVPDMVVVEVITIEEFLLNLQRWCGVIGRASWQTYLVATLGLCLVEIIPVTRGRRWLSKWTNRAYRVIDDTSPEYLPQYIGGACASAEELVMELALKGIGAGYE